MPNRSTRRNSEFRARAPEASLPLARNRSYVRQLLLGEQFVERVRREFARIGEKQALPDFTPRRQAKAGGARCSDWLELKKIAAQAFLRRRRPPG